MHRLAIGVALMVLAAMPASAHYIWIIPDKQGTSAQVVFSDSLEPDNPKFLDGITQTQLFLRDVDNKELPLTWSKGADAFHIKLPGKNPQTIAGVCLYGVRNAESANPYLLWYYAKTGIGDPKQAGPKSVPSKSWERLPLEVVQTAGNDPRKLQVLWQGKPLAGSEVTYVQPGTETVEKLNTDKDGRFEVGAPKGGAYGFRARHIEAKQGVHNGENYKEVRHYSTWVVELPEGAPGGKAASSFAPLPRGISSFGADVADGWVYVYGGHSATTHQYSTESVQGDFQRLKLSAPTTWEALPSGPGLQGLALVAHGGKLYRIGGMQPRNKPGDPTDNHSVATCASFDPATKQWTALPDMPESRSSHEAVVVGDKLIVIGGHRLNGKDKDTDWPKTALVLDLAKKPLQWETIQQPFQSRALTTVVHEGKVHIIGGMTKASAIMLKTTIFDPAKNTWTAGADLPGPESNGFSAASCIAGGRLYVSVGDGRLLRLNGKGDSWEEVGRLAQPRIVHRMFAVNNDSLIALGGANGGKQLESIEQLKLPQ